MCYEKGEGVPQNYPEARRLLALASAQGYAYATEALRRIDEIIRNDPSMAFITPTGRKKPKPNAPCPCGSGNKYKKCCETKLQQVQEVQRQQIQEVLKDAREPGRGHRSS